MGSNPVDLDASSTMAPVPIDHKTADSQRVQEPKLATALPKPAGPQWDGPDDKDNPRNWHPAKKILHVTAWASLGLAVTIGSSLISPAEEEIVRYFHVSKEVAVLPLALFTLGIAWGPSLAAPISETFGRQWVYKGTAVLYLLFMVGAATARSFGGLLACRLFAGASGGPVLAIVGASNADLLPPHSRAYATMTFMAIAFLGPSLGPVVGGFCSQFKGWRWTQYVTIMIIGLALCLLLPTQETYAKIILPRRAKKRGEALSVPKLNRRSFITITLTRPMHMLVSEPAVLLFSLYNAFTFGVLFGFFEAFPIVFHGIYEFPLWAVGLSFIGIAVGVLFGLMLAFLIQRYLYAHASRKALADGYELAAPEHRLYSAMLGSVGIPIGLFWFAWTSRRDIHWISPALAAVPFACGNVSIFISTALYLVDVYGPLNGASAMAANGALRYTVAGVFPLFTTQMYDRLGVAWATSLLGFISLGLLPIPWVFFKYGERIRAKSSYPTLRA